MNPEKLEPQALWDYCLKEYNSNNPVSKYLIKNFYKNIEKIISRHLSQNDSLFEVGCGAGESSARIFKMINSGNRYDISDFESSYVEMIKKYRPNLNVSQENVFNLNIVKDKYDWVIMLEVLEHLENYETALKEIFRVSKKYVIISVPREPFWRILNLVRLKYLAGFGNTPGHINHWSSKSFLSLLKKYGTIISIKKPIPWTIVLIKKNDQPRNKPLHIGMKHD